jgi:SulP family sulfate permease
VSESDLPASDMRRTGGLASLVRRSLDGYTPGDLRADLLAGLTVAAVALPLALAFGITTGLGAEAGIITAIVAGLVAAVFGGSNVQVSGPTGAMTVVLVPIVVRDGANAVFLVGLMAGLLVVGASFARLGRYLSFIPWPVIEGFTVGIAVIIFLQQVPNALGVDKPHGENTVVVAARAVGRVVQGDGSGAAFLVVGLVVATMVLLPRLHRSLPASLAAVLVSTIVVEIAGLHVARIGSLPSSLPVPSLPHVSLQRVSDLFGAALAVAALAAIESLLSAKVADGMSDGEPFDPDRELFGQGLANVVSPLFGGMPATGAIARTAVNVRAGARTRVASIVHSVVLIAVVLVAGPLVERIPIAALAGVLMVTAVRMVEPHNVRSVLRATRGDALVLVITAAVTIAFDLIMAVEVGVAVAAVLALRAVARTGTATREHHDAEVDADTERALLGEHIVTYRIDGAFFFGAAQRFLTELTAVTDVDVVVLRLGEVQVLDATGANALGEIVAELEARGVTVLLQGVRPQHARTLTAVGALNRLSHERHLFDELAPAIDHAHQHAARALAS